MRIYLYVLDDTCVRWHRSLFCHLFHQGVTWLVHLQFVIYSDPQSLFWRPGVYSFFPSLATVQLSLSSLNAEFGSCIYSVASYFCNQSIKNTLNSFLALQRAHSSASLPLLSKGNQSKLYSVISITRLGTKPRSYPPPRNRICYMLLLVTVKHCWCSFAPLQSHFITMRLLLAQLGVPWDGVKSLA